jgi:DNA-binding transcriptional ArsR family regulator
VAHVVRSARSARRLLAPLRLTLLETLDRHGPDSASGLARRLELPRQKINYHLRALEEDGHVELVEERLRGNCSERVVRAAGGSYVVSPEVLGRLAERSGVDDPADAFSAAHLIALAGRAIRDVGRLIERGRQQRKRVATLAIDTEVRFGSAADRSAFVQELTDAVADLAAKYHRADARGGRTFRFVTLGHPRVDASRTSAAAYEEERE